MTAEELIAFEQDIAAEFNAGHIKAPVHLAGGNEQQLISIFGNIRPQDWIFVQWRSHYHCLLKGVPPAELKAEIMAGRSITLNFPEYRIVSSAIAGGHLPLALGVAWQIKREGRDERVWVFCGDMVGESGLFHECAKYAYNFALPLSLIVEDNNKSVVTNTRQVWRSPGRTDHAGSVFSSFGTISYFYELPYPHSGAGQRVNF